MLDRFGIEYTRSWFAGAHRNAGRLKYCGPNNCWLSEGYSQSARKNWAPDSQNSLLKVILKPVFRCPAPRREFQKKTVTDGNLQKLFREMTNPPWRVDKLDKRLSIYTNNEPLLKEILSARIQADLLSWAEQKTDNRVSDIRNDDDNLIFAVTGDFESYEEYTLPLITACSFFMPLLN